MSCRASCLPASSPPAPALPARVETATGKKGWEKSLVGDLGGGGPGWGYSESPLVDGDKVACTPGGGKGTVAALNKKTGEVIWRSTDFTDGAQYSSLVIATA